MSHFGKTSPHREILWIFHFKTTVFLKFGDGDPHLENIFGGWGWKQLDGLPRGAQWGWFNFYLLLESGEKVTSINEGLKKMARMRHYKLGEFHAFYSAIF